MAVKSGGDDNTKPLASTTNRDTQAGVDTVNIDTQAGVDTRDAATEAGLHLHLHQHVHLLATTCAGGADGGGQIKNRPPNQH